MLPGLIWLRVLECACLSKSGRKDDALSILPEIERTRQTEYVDAYYMALLYDAFGMRDRAFAELNRAVEEGSITLCLLDVDPKIDALRADPRFDELRRKVFRPEYFSLSDSSQKLTTQA